MTKVVSSTTHVDLLQTEQGFSHYQRITYDQRASVALALLKIMVKAYAEDRAPVLGDLVLKDLAAKAVTTTVAFYVALNEAGLALYTPSIETLETIAKEGLLHAAPTSTPN